MQKAKEAQAVVAGFVKDPILSKSKFRNQGRYYYAFASFLLKEYGLAQQALTTLTPFSDLHFGNHARYLLARTHHLAEERAEAALHYEGVLNDYAVNKKTAQMLLGQGKVDLAEKACDGSPGQGPAARPRRCGPLFTSACSSMRPGNFGEALTRFAEFPKLYPQSPLRNDAEMRIGFCQVQMRAFGDAMKTLTPLIDREPGLSDQVLFWLGKAQAGTADREQPAQLSEGPDRGHRHLQAGPGAFAEAPCRRPDHGRSAAARFFWKLPTTSSISSSTRKRPPIYGQLLRDKMLPPRDEEISLRLVTALHLAGDFDESDRQCKAVPGEIPQEHAAPGRAVLRWPRTAISALSPGRRRPALPNRPRNWPSSTPTPPSCW